MNRLFRLACDNSAFSEKNLVLCSITHDEINGLRPFDNKAKNFAFAKGYVVLAELDIANFLVNKYSFLHIVDAYGNQLDQSDELDEVVKTNNLNYIYELAIKYKVDIIEKTMDEIKLDIREARLEQEKYLQAGSV